MASNMFPLTSMVCVDLYVIIIKLFCSVSLFFKRTSSLSKCLFGTGKSSSSSCIFFIDLVRDSSSRNSSLRWILFTAVVERLGTWISLVVGTSGVLPRHDFRAPFFHHVLYFIYYLRPLVVPLGFRIDQVGFNVRFLSLVWCVRYIPLVVRSS